VLKVLQRSYFDATAQIAILVRLPRLRDGSLGAQALIGTAVFRLRQSAGASRRRETPRRNTLGAGTYTYTYTYRLFLYLSLPKTPLPNENISFGSGVLYDLPQLPLCHKAQGKPFTGALQQSVWKLLFYHLFQQAAVAVEHFKDVHSRRQR
jgi:hypothetical protein